MDKNKWIKIGLIIILIALVIITVALGNAHSNTKKLAKELTVQIDTLTSTLEDYNDLSVKYVDLQNEMIKTSNELGLFKDKLIDLTKSHQSSLSEIKDKLSDLVVEFDSVQAVIPIDSVNMDDLKF